VCLRRGGWLVRVVVCRWEGLMGDGGDVIIGESQKAL